MAFLFDAHFQAAAANGSPLSGATLSFYRAGTTTKISVYQDEQATTPHTNPVVADASGTFPAIFIATKDKYKYVLKDADGITVQTADRIPSIQGQVEAGQDEILNQLMGIAGGPSIVRETKSGLDLVTPDSEDYGGVVLNDPDPTNNGYFYRDAADWVKGRGFPDTFARVELAGSGTAQTGAVSAGVNPADVEVFYAFVGADNTGPLTLAIGGEEPREVVNLAGNPLSAGEWSGVVMFALVDGRYQLLLDAGAAASAAQSASDASDSADDAEAAAIRAEAAASGVEYPVSYAPQVLSEAQQEQARENIGAVFADDDDVWSAATGQVLTTEKIETASAFESLTDQSPISWDWDGGINFTVTVADNRTLALPTNGQPGTWRTITLAGSSATLRTLAFASGYGGDTPVLTDITNTKKYMLMIFCKSSSQFLVSAMNASDG